MVCEEEVRMKRNLLISVLVTALLGIAAIGWAQEASVFDNVEKIIGRVYSVPGAVTCGQDQDAQCYSIYLEVRNSSGDYFSSACETNIVVTDLANPAAPIIGNNHVYTLYDAAMSPEFSVTLDPDTGKIFVFCDSGALVKKYSVVNNNNGLCGSANEGNFLTTPSSGLCNAGSASTVSGSGPWTWTCSGESCGGAVAECSANKKINGACGTAINSCTSGTFVDVQDTSTNNLWKCTGENTGSDAQCSIAKVNGVCGSSNGSGPFSSTPPNLCNPGSASTPANNGTGQWTWSCTGSNNGTTASCSATAPVNGDCGSANGQSLASAPTTDLCDFSGTTPTVSGSGPWTWTCTGINTGSNANCSANSLALSDLFFYKVIGPGSVGSGNGFSFTMTVKNQGVGASGPAKVSCYYSGDRYPGAPDPVISCSTPFPITIPALNPGASVTQTFSGCVVSGSIHSGHFVACEVNADRAVTESNYSNNAGFFYFTIGW